MAFYEIMRPIRTRRIGRRYYCRLNLKSKSFAIIAMGKFDRKHSITAFNQKQFSLHHAADIENIQVLCGLSSDGLPLIA